MKQKIVKTMKILLLVGLITAIIGLIGGLGLIGYLLKDTPPLDLTKIYGAESTIIYDKDGNIISEFGVEKREWVSYQDISPVMIDAILATEDSRFFKHPGVDFQRLVVAVVTNLLTGDDQGASTITQQLIKQTHLTSAKTINRKVQEIYLALQLEKKLSKEQIIEAYLNYSPFGGGIYGVEKAAQYYFGVHASELTLPQAALLAGLVQRPEGYRPDYYPDLAEYRRDHVLNYMTRHGYISEETAQLAKAKPVTDLLVYQELEVSEKVKYQSFIDAVLNEVEQKYGLDPRSGLQIYTTMDSKAQALAYDLQHPTLSKDYQITWPQEMQSGIIFMDTQTGEVRAIGGGYNPEGLERTYNLATQLERQPGSTAKPIFAYGPALEYLDWGTGTMLNDELYTYQNGSGTIIHNYTNEYLGRMTIRYALNKSLNVPAVKAFNAVGSEMVQRFAEGLGFSFSEPVSEPAAIGGVSTGFSPLLLAGAYATFGNGGTYHEPITISKIILSDGNEIKAKQESHRAMSEETAYLMTDMLHTVMTEGTGTVANVSGMYLSGKTGTTNFPKEIRDKYNFPSNAIRDSWFVGYSSDYTAAIWTGYTDASKGQYINNQTQSMPWKVFNRLMKELNTAGSEKPDWLPTIQAIEVEKESGEVDGEVQKPSAHTPSDYRITELFPTRMKALSVSNRFNQLETPQNIKVSVENGKILNVTWDHILSHSLPEDALKEKIAYAKSLATNASTLKEMNGLTYSEAELRMKLKQIQTIGATIYEVYGVDYQGNATLLGQTIENSFQLKDLTRRELSSYQSVYLQAKYEKLEHSQSEKSKVVDLNCKECIQPIELPDFSGWTKKQLQKWAKEHEVSVEYVETISETVKTGEVISTEPSKGILTPQETLTVLISKQAWTVPDFSNQENVSLAYQEWALENGITLKIKELHRDNIPVGGFIKINPGINETIKPNQTLILTISKGPKNPTKPPVSTEKEEEIDSNPELELPSKD